MTTESPRWYKSSYSDNGGTCVEVAANIPGVVPVRDSKAPHGPRLVFPASSWSSFVDDVKTGNLSTP
ncbi:DUF397 domain-containing protein [Streptomyces sp. NPDC050355]|uniref:DUF397 domain-containing protein n=1 Tax=Streptomyces sirii TaxID=3127701 RepID=A0ABZ2QNE5_9ACTN